MPITPEQFKEGLATWASGITVVTTRREGGIHGMTASAFCSVSLSPPLVLVCVNRRNRTHEHLEDQISFGVHILKVGQEDLALRAGGLLGDSGNLLEGVPFHIETTGAPILDDSLAWLDCTRWASYDGGDHTIFIGLVEASGVNHGEPLLWFERGFRRLNDPPEV